MITFEDQETINQLHEYVWAFDRWGKTPRQFWEGFHLLAGDISSRVFVNDADAELSEKYCDVLASADDGGYAVPEELTDVPYVQSP